ncbi:MAG: trehalose-6-phosphate synthase [Deltaproteobacteria bacterium]
MKNEPERRLVIVSNRLPVVIERDGQDWSIRPSSGGLVTALAPVLRNRGGLWIGWPGTMDEVELDEPLAAGAKSAGYSLKSVTLSREDRDKFYYGFSNEIIWPLFHDLQGHCNFDPDYWVAYQTVNRNYAEVVKEEVRSEDYLWVHDYHLMNVARELRQLGVDAPIGFFLHIPFPPLDIFMKLPWRFEILQALLEYDLIGLQTLRDQRNFTQCVRTVIKDVHVRGKGQVVSVELGHRDVRVGAFPISIDYRSFAEHAVTHEIADRAWYIHEDLPKRHIVLGVDRLDYTKGIPYKFEAFRNLLTRYPELREKITLLQVVVPSREDIPRYQSLKMEIERLVGEINGLFTVSGWVPIIYIYRNLDRPELLAYYRTAEIALVTPLKDGMNLVAKEYCACSVEEDCVLVLSEFAGAAAQLQKAALLVNPYHIESMADALYQAFTMDMAERRSRMARLRKSVRENDIFRWVDSFLNAAIGRELGDFPPLDDYLPQVEIT